MSLSRSLSHKLFVTAAFGVVAALTLSGCGSASPESSASSGVIQEVKFGYIGDFNGASLLAIADAKGLWEKHGLEADTKVFTNGPLQIQALGTGDLDFGYIGPGAMWLPVRPRSWRSTPSATPTASSPRRARRRWSSSGARRSACRRARPAT